MSFDLNFSLSSIDNDVSLLYNDNSIIINKNINLEDNLNYNNKKEKNNKKIQLSEKKKNAEEKEEENINDINDIEMERKNKKIILNHSLEPEEIEAKQNSDIHKNNNNNAEEEKEIECLYFIQYQDYDQNDDNILIKN